MDITPAFVSCTCSRKEVFHRVPNECVQRPELDSFDVVLEELREMHHRKNQDYGRDHDPYANVRSSQDFGMPAWVGGMVRANDKMRRIQRAASGHDLKNESLEDSLIDLAVYSIISLILFREEQTDG